MRPYPQSRRADLLTGWKPEKNHHAVVVFLIINESPADSNFENRQGKHRPLPAASEPLAFLSSSLLMFKFSAEYDLTVIFLNESNHVLFRDWMAYLS